MSRARRSFWNERHAVRDEITVVLLGMGFVVAMGISLIVMARL
jgi:hypothetical protein